MKNIRLSIHGRRQQELFAVTQCIEGSHEVIIFMVHTPVFQVCCSLSKEHPTPFLGALLIAPVRLIGPFPNLSLLALLLETHNRQSEQ